MFLDGQVIRLYKGATIDLSKWDKSDFVVPKVLKGITITKKVAELLEKNKISNLSLDNMTEVGMNVKFGTI